MPGRAVVQPVPNPGEVLSVEELDQCLCARHGDIAYVAAGPAEGSFAWLREIRDTRKCSCVVLMGTFEPEDMERAKMLLRLGGKRINQTARRLRYRDVEYFGCVFKKRVGMVPSEFRRICRAGAEGKAIGQDGREQASH